MEPTQASLVVALLDKLLPPALAFVAGMFTPWVKWHIEKNRQRVEYRRQLVTAWRKMVADVATKDTGSSSESFKELLEKHEDFYSLCGHLSRETIGEIATCRTTIVGSTLPAPLQMIIEDIGDIERKWSLV
jgi:hypothetical protein